MSGLRVRIQRVRGDRDADLPLPAPATAGSAGVDLRAALEKELTLEPGDRAAIPTGFSIEIPPGYEGQIRARSGLALRYGITLPNAPGTIDSDYRGEVHVIVQNVGREPFTLRRGERIAQLVVSPVAIPVWEEVPPGAELGTTRRGPGGFGHTGR